MTESLVSKAANRVFSAARMAKYRLGQRSGPAIVPSDAPDDALGELEAVTASTRFPGWLNVPASIVTLHLLRILPTGPVMEIGVFRGKYLSILRGALGASGRIVGYDIFDQAQAPLIETDFAEVFGTLGNVRLVQVDSTRLTPDRVLADCGGAPVFISIDGSHEGDPVLSDMTLAVAVMDEAGIVAMDDFLNPVALGVNEAVGRFMCAPDPGLVPFAYVANKLFMCRPAFHAAYLRSVEEHMVQRGNDPSFPFWVENIAQGEDLRRRFYGWDVLIVTG